MHRTMLVTLGAAVALAFAGGLPTSAGIEYAGNVIKGKHQPSLYYVSADGQRYVFPNDKAYHSWYADFSGVVEVEDSQLAALPLAGNVVYRPGVVLVKLQTDPKVYAVSQGGILRWVKTEELAKQLYGANWHLLVDDVPDSFFMNYRVGSVVERAEDFDPDDEEVRIATVDDNRKAKQERKAAKAKQSFCERSQKQINRIQERLARRGVTISTLGDDFIERCVAQATPAQPGNKGKSKGKDKGKGKEDDHKVAICHIPPGNPAARRTIVVGKPAAKAHLAHGDTLGRCAGEGDQGDRTAPVLSSIATASTTSSTTRVTWATNEDATGKVTYATSSLALASSTQSVSGSALVQAHDLTLTGLAAATTYYFRVESADAAGNTATSSERAFTTLGATADVTAPVIWGIAATAATSTATVTWTTNEASTSEAVYTTLPLASATTTQSASNAALVTSHSLTLANLTASTTYYFLVKSTDAAGNTASSTQQAFLTAGL